MPTTPNYGLYYPASSERPAAFPAAQQTSQETLDTLLKQISDSIPAGDTNTLNAARTYADQKVANANYATPQQIADLGISATASTTTVAGRNVPTTRRSWSGSADAAIGEASYIVADATAQTAGYNYPTAHGGILRTTPMTSGGDTWRVQEYLSARTAGPGVWYRPSDWQGSFVGSPWIQLNASPLYNSGLRSLTKLMGLTSGNAYLHVTGGWVYLLFEDAVMPGTGSVDLSTTELLPVAPQQPVGTVNGNLTNQSSVMRRIGVNRYGRTRAYGIASGDVLNGSLTWPMTRPDPTTPIGSPA